MRPKIVTICGSSRFIGTIAVCSWLLERDEDCMVFGLHLLPSWYPGCPEHHLAEHEEVSEKMDELHRRKIDLSEEIFVVNVNDYIGDSTRAEIDYARSCGKRIRWFTNDEIGTRCAALMEEK